MHEEKNTRIPKSKQAKHADIIFLWQRNNFAGKKYFFINKTIKDGDIAPWKDLQKN